MKVCCKCSQRFEDDRLVCIDCLNCLEEPFYFSCIWASLAMAIPISLAFRLLGFTGAGVLLEIFIWQSTLLVVGYPLAKAIQRVRTPSRPVLCEIKSVFAVRGNRIVLLGIVAVSLWFGFAVLKPLLEGRISSAWEDPSWQDAVMWIRVSILNLLPLVTLLFILDQGWAFFDLSSANTYVSREERRLRGDS